MIIMGSLFILCGKLKYYFIAAWAADKATPV